MACAIFLTSSLWERHKIGNAENQGCYAFLLGVVQGGAKGGAGWHGTFIGFFIIVKKKWFENQSNGN